MLEAAIEEVAPYRMGEYEELMEDIFLAGKTVKGFAGELGLSVSTVYRWKKLGVPRYAVAYVEKLLELKTLAG